MTLADYVRELIFSGVNPDWAYEAAAVMVNADQLGNNLGEIYLRMFSTPPPDMAIRPDFLQRRREQFTRHEFESLIFGEYPPQEQWNAEQRRGNVKPNGSLFRDPELVRGDGLLSPLKVKLPKQVTFTVEVSYQTKLGTLITKRWREHG